MALISILGDRRRNQKVMLLFPLFWLVFVSYRTFGVDRWILIIDIYICEYILQIYPNALPPTSKAEGWSSDWGHCQSVSGWILWPHFLTEQSKLCHRNVIEFEGFSALLRFWFFKIKISNLKRGTTLGDDNFTDIPKFCHITAKWGFQRGVGDLS